MRRLIALAALLTLAGCVTDQAAPVDCNKLTNVYEMNSCIYNRSVTKVSSTGCRDIMNETMKADCIDQVSVRLLDYMPCKQHDKASRRDACEKKVSDMRKLVREQNPGAKLP